MKLTFVLLLNFIILIFSLESFGAVEQTPAARCTLSYTDFANSNRVGFAINSSVIQLEKSQDKVTSRNDFAKIQYKSDCQKCGSAITLTSPNEKSGFFRQSVASVTPIKDRFVVTEIERTAEALQLKVKIYDDVETFAVTGLGHSMFGDDFTTYFRTNVEGQEGVVSVTCRVYQ